MNNKNYTWIFAILSFITFCIATITVAEPVSKSWPVIALSCNFLTIICSILVLVYGFTTFKKINITYKIINVICMTMISLLWLWYISIAFFNADMYLSR